MTNRLLNVCKWPLALCAFVLLWSSPAFAGKLVSKPASKGGPGVTLQENKMDVNRLYATIHCATGEVLKAEDHRKSKDQKWCWDSEAKPDAAKTAEFLAAAAKWDSEHGFKAVKKIAKNVVPKLPEAPKVAPGPSQAELDKLKLEYKNLEDAKKEVEAALRTEIVYRDLSLIAAVILLIVAGVFYFQKSNVQKQNKEFSTRNVTLGRKVADQEALLNDIDSLEQRVIDLKNRKAAEQSPEMAENIV